MRPNDAHYSPSELGRLASAFSQAPVAFALLIGPKHIFEVVNRQYEILTGRTDLIGRSVVEALPEVEDQGFIAILDRVFNEGERFQAHEMAVRLSANPASEPKEFYLDFTYEPFFDGDHEVVGILVSAVDVTEQVTARERLKQSAEEFRVLAEATPQMLFTALPNGNIIYFNQQWTDYTGYSFEETKDWGWKPVLYSEDYERTVETWKQALISGQPYEIEYRLRRKDGTFRWHLGRALPVRDSHGEITKWVGTNIDIHEQRRQAEALSELRHIAEQERHKFEAMFADASTSLAVTRGPSHVYEHANPSYLALFEGREMIGKPLLEALPELTGQKFPSYFDHVYRTGETYREQEAQAFLRRSSDGPLEERYFDQSYSLLPDAEGRPYGIFIHAIEVTDRVFARRRILESEARLKSTTEELRTAKEAAEQANAAKSVFLANMSHEIRTPLGAIMGFVDLIKDGTASPAELESHLTIIQRNSRQLMRIIDDILDLSKVEAGMMQIEELDFSLVELLADFSSLMDLRAREKGIVFEVKHKSALPNMVTSDPTRLRQVLTNIVGNAIKFSERGRVTLSVGYENESLVFEVEDTGRGISPEQQKGLFQPFAQGDVSITRKFGGTGLGLVLTRKICTLLGGSFELERSVPGQGSTFIARVRVRIPGATVPRSEGETAARKNVVALQGLRVLLVEDSLDNQALVSIILGRAGAIMEVASDGAAGIEAAMRGSHDVVLMDVQMPVMDGLTAVTRLRELGYQKPVVALTAHAMKEERDRCIAAGFSDFLAKPIERGAVIGLLSRLKARLSAGAGEP